MRVAHLPFESEQRLSLWRKQHMRRHESAPLIHRGHDVVRIQPEATGPRPSRRGVRNTPILGAYTGHHRQEDDPVPERIL